MNIFLFVLMFIMAIIGTAAVVSLIKDWNYIPREVVSWILFFIIIYGFAATFRMIG